MCRQQRSADSRAAAAAGGGMLTMSSRNYDYDYDAVQPYFLLDGEEEDFYLPPRSQLLPGPGEDIWKKFELLPTPPLSPSRRPSPPDALLSAAQHLEAVSDLLEDDRDPAAALLQSFVIQDCMWSSSFAAATKLEKVVSERLASLRARRDSATAAERQPGGSRVNAGYLQDLHAAAADCIDPSAVLPYAALSESSAGGAETEELCPDSPPLSGSDSESEEEDEEGEGGEEEVEEEEEEEEEEIDVVTVVKRRVSRRSAPSSRALVLKRSHINIHQHNYAAQQPAGVKRLKPEGGGGGGGGGRRCCSPRSDGGGEGVKRRTHNVLERQRRTELTRSFAALRDQIPALSDNHKAAKVSILKTATEFVWEVGADERRLLTTKSELRKRSRALRHRLEQLRTLR